MSKTPNKDEQTIEQKLTALRASVAWFEGDDFQLEKAPERYEQAAKLASEIDADLETLQNNVTILKEKFDRA